MNKNTHYVFSVDCNGKYYAEARTISNSCNLKYIIERIPGLMHINACDSKKEAVEIAHAWNTAYMENGTHQWS